MSVVYCRATAKVMDYRPNDETATEMRLPWQRRDVDVYEDNDVTYRSSAAESKSSR